MSCLENPRKTIIWTSRQIITTVKLKTYKQNKFKWDKRGSWKENDTNWKKNLLDFNTVQNLLSFETCITKTTHLCFWEVNRNCLSILNICHFKPGKSLHTVEARTVDRKLARVYFLLNVLKQKRTPSFHVRLKKRQ